MGRDKSGRDALYKGWESELKMPDRDGRIFCCFICSFLLFSLRFLLFYFYIYKIEDEKEVKRG